ncbi:MAG TPA: hypothetical protein GXX36_06210 [Clostridiaceae bacterium]|nr:hypothetical protein [Clostridiaceae bacterium]
MSNVFMRFIKEEDGLGTVEIVIIIAILVGIALIFRHSIVKFVTRIINQVFGNENINNQIDSQSILDSYNSQNP